MALFPQTSNKLLKSRGFHIEYVDHAHAISLPRSLSSRLLSILIASLRQEARERRIISNVKPFKETLRVTNPVRQSRASSRKRVLRGGG